MTKHKVFIVKSLIGTFAFSDKGDVVYYELFRPDASLVLSELSKETSGDFLSHLNDYEIIEKSVGDRFMREKIREYAVSLSFVKDEKEFNNFLVEFGILFSKCRLKGVIGRDRLVVQAFNAMEDMGKIINLLKERMYEWYSLHYPGINEKDISKLVARHGRRDNFPNYEESHGVDINEDDEKIFKEYAELILNTEDEKKRLEKYIKSCIKDIMPNFTALIGESLAAGFLSKAGSLEKLAKMPASTIQLLGSEKALFRHLHKKGKSPKYGIIYNSSFVQHAKNKGKVARILSSKLMLASRMDFYSGRIDNTLKEKLIEELRGL